MSSDIEDIKAEQLITSLHLSNFLRIPRLRKLEIDIGVKTRFLNSSFGCERSVKIGQDIARRLQQ